MEITGKTKTVAYNGKTLRLCNQTSKLWTHLYNEPNYPSEANDDLHAAGCGIFSVAHVADYLTGEKIDVEELADFSMANGGRGDDGTDRPGLLKALEESGRLEKLGLHYEMEGSINDHEALWTVLTAGGAALANLRPGHIVALVDTRVENGERQLLVMDSWRDSIHTAVWKDVRGVIEDSEVISAYETEGGVVTGTDRHYTMFWVPLTKPKDFNLLRKIEN